MAGRKSSLWLTGQLALLCICAYLAFYGYGCQRTSSGPLERRLDQKIAYALRTAKWLALPVVIVAVPILSACLYRRFEVPRARLAAGLCPACKYPLVSKTTLCPECGLLPAEPSDTTLRVIGRFFAATVIVLLLGTALGSVVAEVRIAPDERAFIAEVESLGPSHQRLRRGPFYGELSFIPGHGYWTVDD